MYPLIIEEQLQKSNLTNNEDEDLIIDLDDVEEAVENIELCIMNRMSISRSFVVKWQVYGGPRRESRSEKYGKADCYVNSITVYI